MNPDQSFPARAAHDRIRRVEDVVHSGRRFRSRVLILAAVLALAYFAVLGTVIRSESALLEAVLTLAPVIAVVTLADVWGRRRGLESRQLLQQEYRLGAVFAVLVCVAGVLATVLPHPVPAAFAGLLPAAVCLVGAWQVRSR